MNRAHRIADQFRSVVGWLGRVPTESQFVTRGFLTPAEFVEAGDQLVFQCPTWQWQSCPDKKHQVFWLPANKQYLLTRNIACKHRVHDWEQSFCKQAHVTSEGWLVPGPQPSSSAGVGKHEGSVGGTDSGDGGGPGISPHGGGGGPLGPLCSGAIVAPTYQRILECKVRTADGSEFAVRHEAESSSNSEGSYLDEEEEGSVNNNAAGPGTPGRPEDNGGGVSLEQLRSKEEVNGGDDFVDVAGESSGPPIGVQARLANMITRGANQLSLAAQGKQSAASRGGTASIPGASNNSGHQRAFAIEADDFTLILNNEESTPPEASVEAPTNPSISTQSSRRGRRRSEGAGKHDANPTSQPSDSAPSLPVPGDVRHDGKPSNKGRRHKGYLVPTRSYDLSITYDKYYQSPRLWLFGYDESGVPLRSDAVFEDIHSDYLSKTVTVDPHPFTGVPTVSVHPCKHASVMRTVAQNWLKAGMQPRHDLALFVLLKMVASVVPTINYDFTIDIEMPIGLALPVESVGEDESELGAEEGSPDHSR